MNKYGIRIDEARWKEFSALVKSHIPGASVGYYMIHDGFNHRVAGENKWRTWIFRRFNDGTIRINGFRNYNEFLKSAKSGCSVSMPEITLEDFIKSDLVHDEIKKFILLNIKNFAFEG